MRSAEEPMNARERLMTVLRSKGRADRIPWSPLLDGYFMSSYSEEKDIIDAYRDFGADVMERHVLGWRSSLGRRRERDLLGTEPTNTASFEEAGVRVTLETRSHEKGRLLTRSYEIPGRRLTSAFLYTETSPYIPFPVERLIKTVEDLEAYRYVKLRESYTAEYERFLREDRRIGDAGIATESGPTSPIQELLQILIGVEPFYMTFYTDHLAELESLMEVMHEKNMEAYGILAASPAEVIIDYENTSTTLASPDIYGRHSLQQINAYADILHERHKVFLTHRCGTLKGLVPLLQEGRDDGIVDINPPPTGNLGLREAAEAMPDKVVMGGLDPTVLARWSVERVVDHVREMLRPLRASGAVILGSGDAVPMDARRENLRAIGDVVREDA